MIAEGSPWVRADLLNTSFNALKNTQYKMAMNIKRDSQIKASSRSRNSTVKMVMTTYQRMAARLSLAL